MKKILIILLFFSTSCMKYTDLGDLSIVKSIGITYQDKYTLYAEVYDEIKKDNEPKTKIIGTSGETISELFINLNQLSQKEIFLSHIDLLVLEKNLNNDNYREIINYFLHNKYLRNDFLCILSEDTKSLLINSHYDEIENFIKTNNDIKKIIIITFDEVINNYLNNNPFSLSVINYNNILEHVDNVSFFNKNGDE